jgi:hypothetical protein
MQKPPIGGVIKSNRPSIGFGTSAAKPTLQNLVEKYMSKDNLKVRDSSANKSKEVFEAPKVGNK